MPNRQRKSLLQGLHDMVAQDRVLQSIAYNAAMNSTKHLWTIAHEAPYYPYVAHLPHKPGEQVLPILWKKIHEDGPPGLIIARHESCDQQLVIDLGCLSDSTGLLVTATEQLSLDVSVRLRGDIQASAVGPQARTFVEAVQVWAESFGIMPRSFPDTMTPPLWGVVASICESMY